MRGGGWDREKVIRIKIKKKEKDCRCKVIHRIGGVLQTMQNAAKESASLIVCGGRAFQNLGEELEKALKPNPVFF